MLNMMAAFGTATPVWPASHRCSSDSNRSLCGPAALAGRVPLGPKGWTAALSAMRAVVVGFGGALPSSASTLRSLLRPTCAAAIAAACAACTATLAPEGVALASARVPPSG